MITEVNGITVTYNSELERLEAEVDTAWTYLVRAALGSKEEDVARDTLLIARATLAAFLEYTPEPYLQFVDEKTEPTFNFEDDFGDMDTLATTAIESQVGGGHYKKGIQPLEGTFANFGYEGVAAAIYTLVNKYLTREKGTHRQDLTKAIHVLQMQLEFYDRFNAVDTLAPNHNMQPVEGNK